MGKEVGKVGLGDIHVAEHAQIIHKRVVAGTSVVVTKQFRLVATNWERVEIGKRGLLDGGRGHGKHGDVQLVVRGRTQKVSQLSG